MREILFRGKRTDNGEWVEGYFVKKIDPLFKTEICFILIQEYDKSCIDGTPTVLKSEMTWVRVIPDTVGQFTGLTENGKRIFEGDIACFHEDNQDPCYCVIKHGEYSTGHIGFYTAWYKGGSTIRYFRKDLGFWVQHGHIEVIGNIHDNPELLEVDKE